MLRREGKWVRGLMHSMEFLWVYICIGGWDLISLSAINNAILFTLAPKASQSLHREVALRVFASWTMLRNGIALAWHARATKQFLLRCYYSAYQLALCHHTQLLLFDGCNSVSRTAKYRAQLLF